MNIKQGISAAVLSAVLGSAMVFPGMAASFPDVASGADYAEAVDYVSDMGLMVGDKTGKFHPDQAVTRAEMATILCNMLGETENLSTDGSVFTDVPADHWANRYVVKAAELGLVSGYGNGKFGPSDQVTYEQAITMVVNQLNGRSLAQSEGGYPNGFISVAQSHGLLDGVNAKQGQPLVRSDIAIILKNCDSFYFDSTGNMVEDGAQTE